jgi:hypothetical protein
MNQRLEKTGSNFPQKKGGPEAARIKQCINQNPN